MAPNGMGPPNTTKKLAHWVDLLGQLLSLKREGHTNTNLLYTGLDNVGDLLTLVVSMALEMKSVKRELASRLIADLYGRVIAPKYMEDAFVVLLKQVKN